MFEFIWDELPGWIFRFIGIIVILLGLVVVLLPIFDWWLEALR